MWKASYIRTYLPLCIFTPIPMHTTTYTSVPYFKLPISASLHIILHKYTPSPPNLT